MEDFTKVYRIGTIPEREFRADVFIKATYKGGNLAIDGVIGPKRNGDAVGGCGQIDMEFGHRDASQNDKRTTNLVRPSKFNFAKGWDREKWLDLLDVWHNWHLNDMQAACEHQRAGNWGKDDVEVVTYKLTSEAWKIKKGAEVKATEAAIADKVAGLTEAEKFLVGPDWYKDRFSPPDADSPLSGLYEVKKRENKSTGWVRETEHPKGVLSKACPVCEYKYGTKWLRKDVPGDVLDFLAALPPTDKQPAWV